VALIGMGVGDPESLTYEASRVLAGVDVLFTVDKGPAKADLNALRAEICARHAKPGLRVVAVGEPERDRSPADYGAEVRRWHAARADVWAQALRAELDEAELGAFLVWGDPALYDSTLRVIERMRPRVDFDYEVIPGITSVQTLTAVHRITLNRIGEPIHITTGRRLATGFPEDLDSVVVMLDAALACEPFDDGELEIFWGAYLGTPDQVLMSGRLVDVAAEIARTKRELREKHGWIMDTYLLRRPLRG